MVVDAERGCATEHAHIGDRALRRRGPSRGASPGRRRATRVNALFADQFGVWVSGPGADPRRARRRGRRRGRHACRRSSGAQQGGLRAAGQETLASILQSAAARSDRSEIDAITDGLTGLYNHRYLHDRLREEMQRARSSVRRSRFCSATSTTSRSSTKPWATAPATTPCARGARSSNSRSATSTWPRATAARSSWWSLIGTDADGAADVAERIRERVHETWISPSPRPLSISIGVATFPADAAPRRSCSTRPTGR